MFNKKFLSAIFLLAATISSPAYAIASQKDWKQITRNDLYRIHDSLIANTPQYIDKYKPFMDWLDKGLAESLRLAQKVNTQAGYYYALSYYTQGFHNGHIAVNIGKLPAQYAGLLLQYQNGEYKVKFRDYNYNDLPPLNAQLLSCDGKPIQDFIDQDIIHYQFTPKLEASYNKAANYLFFDANPFRHYPKECLFQVNNEKKQYALQWHEITPTQSNEIKKHFNKHYIFQISRFGQNGLWISIPTLFPQEGAERNFLDLLVKIAPYYRTFDPLVIDVRGNTGGNSSWAWNLLASLYSEDFIQSVIAPKESGDTFYRVSKNNIERKKWFAQLYPGTSKTVEKFQAAERAGLKMLKMSGEDDQVKNYSKKPIPMFNNHLYFLTDDKCFSACLDFADYVHWLPKTIHIGLTTDADSPYTENNIETLSGGAQFTYTVNIHRHRRRGDNQPYIPKYRYHGDITDTDQVIHWVEKIYAQQN